MLFQDTLTLETPPWKLRIGRWAYIGRPIADEVHLVSFGAIYQVWRHVMLGVYRQASKGLKYYPKSEVI